MEWVIEMPNYRDAYASTKKTKNLGKIHKEKKLKKAKQKCPSLKTTSKINMTLKMKTTQRLKQHQNEHNPKKWRQSENKDGDVTLHVLPHATMHVGQHLGVFMNISYHKTPLNIKITKKLKQHLKNEDELKKRCRQMKIIKMKVKKEMKIFQIMKTTPKMKVISKRKMPPKIKTTLMKIIYLWVKSTITKLSHSAVTYETRWKCSNTFLPSSVSVG